MLRPSPAKMQAFSIMPNLPLLIFPQPTVANRRDKFGRASEVTHPTPQRQISLLEPKLLAIERYFAQRTAQLRRNLAGVEPEDVLVLETIGAVDDFVRAINRIPGLDWLGEFNVDNIPPDEEFYKDEEHRKDLLSGRLYLIMSNQQGLQQLLVLFQTFKANPDHPMFRWGQGRWRHIFSQLKDIRPWGPDDRLRDTGFFEDWQERLEYGQETVPVEIELWFRANATKRIEATRTVTNRIRELRGDVAAEAIVEPIRYHSLIGKIPIRALGNATDLPKTTLLGSSEIMLLRPVGQASATLPEEDSTPGFPNPTSPLPEVKSPIVALLDGLPLENHLWLSGRLTVDDVEDWASDTPAEGRVHGTAMASLILHGELDSNGTSLTRLLYVRPIMKPNAQDFRRPREESIPDNVLPTDIVHRAVRRLYENIEGEGPVAQDVKIVNLSVCERNRQFYQYPSPWARVIDYLSWHYNILFLISAGNHLGDLKLETPIPQLSALMADHDQLGQQVLKAVNNDARNRRLCVPAEAINALTVGALHTDASTAPLNQNIIDPFQNHHCVSPFSAQGTGFRRSVKPDILMPGGRQTYRDNIIGHSGKVVLTSLGHVRPPGQRVASPSKQLGTTDATIHTRGTSNAAALATRLAAQLYDLIIVLRAQPNGNLLVDHCVPTLIKALIVHGSSWGMPGQTIRNLLQTNEKDKLTRLLGYGPVDETRLFDCTEERATIIGSGLIYDGQAHRYSIPLPFSLSRRKIKRKLTVTLAWLSPVNSSHQGYRKAQLWFEPYGETRENNNAMSILRIAREQTDNRAAKRGTVQHEVFEGEEASPYGLDDIIQIQVNCSADAGKLVESVRYALVATLEVAPGQGIPIYEEIRIKIQQPVPIEVRT